MKEEEEKNIFFHYCVVPVFYVPALQKHLPHGGKLSKKFHSFGREEYQPGANPLILPMYMQYIKSILYLEYLDQRWNSWTQI
jgi:hypothetical protein